MQTSIPDGIIATVICVDYLKRLTDNVRYTWREREYGHGVNVGDIDKDTDLLIIVDSSSSEVDSVNELAKHMDVIILDHHNVEKHSEKLNAILINPNQDGCPYKNKHTSGAGVTFRFIELLDYKYKKVDVDSYLDVVAMSLLSDQMRMDNMENRYFVKKGLSHIYNVGLAALISATKNNGKELNANIMNFSVIPIINTTTRNNEMYKAFKLLFEKDYQKALRMAKQLVKENNERKEKVKELSKEYQKYSQNEKFVYVVRKDATKNYNGLISQRITSALRKPSFVLRDNGSAYQGSVRSYNGFDVQSFLKKCPYVNYAAGHAEALGVGIDASNWNKFKQYVDDNIDENLFRPIIYYDIELTEDELTWGFVEDVLSFDRIYGNGSPKINIRINGLFIHDREVFKESHVKIKTEKLELLKFNEPDYAEDVDSFDVIDVIGTIDVSEWQGVRKIQVFIEDYKKC